MNGLRSRSALATAILLLALAAASPALAGDELSREAAWLRDYLRVDTTNPPGNEAAAAELLAGILRTEGIASERYVTPAGRVSLVARVPPTVPDGGWVALVHHLDVVPANGESWSKPPFAGEIENGDLVGRGAIDDKSLGIAHLAALIDSARSPVRRRGVLYLAVADEESGGGEGLGWLLAHHAELFEGVEAALGEGGLNRTVLGRTFFWGIEVAQKRALWLKLTARGRPSHGSSLNPESAAHQLVQALDRVLERPTAWKLQPPVERFFASFAKIDPGLRERRVDPASAVGPAGPADWVPPGLWGLLVDTVQVTRLDAGERINSVDAEATAELDVRLLPETDADAYLAELRTTLGNAIEVETILATPPSEPSPTGTPLWGELERALAAGPGAAPVAPVMIPGITDSRYLRQRGVAAYGFSPFELEGILLRRVHAPDERIPLAVFDAGVARMLRVVGALVAPTAAP